MSELEQTPASSDVTGGAGGSPLIAGRTPDLGEVLSELSAALSAASSSYDETLEIVVRTASEIGGGPCAVLERAEDDQFRLATAYAQSPKEEEALRALLGGRPFAATGGPLAPLAGAHGQTVVHTVPLAAFSDPAGSPPADLPAGEARLVALVARGRVIGALIVVREADHPSDLLLPHVGERLALALDAAELLALAEAELAHAKQAEQARRTGETTISIVARSGPILLFACDAEGIITLMDGGLLTQFQLRGERLIGRSFLRVFGDYAVIAEHAKRVLEGEAIRRAQIPFEGRSLEAWAQPLRDDDGSVVGFAGIVVDVSARVAAEAAVLDAARRQAALVEHASDVIIVLTGDGTVHYVNPACQRVLGYSWRAGDVVDVLAIVHPDDRDRCRASIREAFGRTGAQTPVEYRIAHANGGWRHVHSIGNNLLDDPAVSGFVVTMRDVTEQRETELRLLANAARQASLAELGRWALVGLDYQSLVEDAVTVLVEQLGADVVHVFESYADASLLTLSASRGHVVAGNELMSIDPTSSPAAFALQTQETVVCEDLRTETRFELPELWTRARTVSVVEVPIPGEDMPVGVLGVGSRQQRSFADEDVNFVKAVANVLAAAAARARAERAIRAQALQDPLTGLANRLLLAEHSSQQARAGEDGDLPEVVRTLFVIDVDRFKEINDTLGHAVGDLVLVELANRFGRLGEPVELVARLGGDEFAVVARNLGGATDELELANRLLTLIGEPIDVGGVKLRLRGSIGIASPEPGGPPADAEVAGLLRRAEVAMYQAKSDHVGVRRFVGDSERSSLSRLALASELAEAIDLGQLRLDYQPKTALSDGRVTGVEALVRWQHPTRGLLLPDVFIPLAEQTGIIRELTNWVLSRALAECSSWHRAGWELPVAVNLSAGTVHDPALLDAVTAALARAGLPPSAIELEITESAVMFDPAGALRTLDALTATGVRFSLDDFGTGYSSLAYLQRLPVTSIKVDKAFVQPLAGDEVAQAIVRAVVELGHSLHLDVIAEGVDCDEVLEATRALGCDAVQGFHIAVPMEASSLRAWLAERSRPAVP